MLVSFIILYVTGAIMTIDDYFVYSARFTVYMLALIIFDLFIQLLCFIRHYCRKLYNKKWELKSANDEIYLSKLETQDELNFLHLGPQFKLSYSLALIYCIILTSNLFYPVMFIVFLLTFILQSCLIKWFYRID